MEGGQVPGRQEETLPMDLAIKITRVIDTISEWTGRIFSWVIVPIVLITVMEVIMRRFLNSPTIWSFEILKQLFGLHFMIVAAYALLYGSHVSVDLVTMNLSTKKRAVVDIISYILFYFPFVIICIKESYSFAAASWAVKERTWSVFAPIIYPIKTVIVITFILLLLQGISEFIKKVYLVKGVKL